MPASEEYVYLMKKVMETLRVYPFGYNNIGSLITDIRDDHNIDATALAQKMGFPTFERLLLHPNCSQYVQVKINSQGQTIYVATPDQKFAHLREEQLKENGCMGRAERIEDQWPSRRQNNKHVPLQAPLQNGSYAAHRNGVSAPNVVSRPASTIPSGSNNEIRYPPLPLAKMLPNGGGDLRPPSAAPVGPSNLAVTPSNIPTGKALPSALGKASTHPLSSPKKRDSDDPIPKGTRHAKSSNFSAFEVPALDGATTAAGSGASNGDDLITFSDGEENDPVKKSKMEIEWDAGSENSPKEDRKDSSLQLVNATESADNGFHHVQTSPEKKVEATRAESVVSGPSGAGSGRLSERSKRREKKKWQEEERKKLVMLIENLVWFRYPKMMSIKELNDIMTVMEPRFVGSGELDFIELHCHKVGTLSGEGNCDLYWKSE